MVKRHLVLWSAFLCGTLTAQVSLTNGVNSLEISGALSTYYNYRILDSVSTNKDKNRFNLRDAQIQFEGRLGKIWEYKLQVDIADMALGSVDPENPGLMDAWINIRGEVGLLSVLAMEKLLGRALR